jgi:hypothetical protein
MKEFRPPNITTEKDFSPVSTRPKVIPPINEIRTPPMAATTQANIHDKEKTLVTGMAQAWTANWSSAVALIAMPILWYLKNKDKRPNITRDIAPAHIYSWETTAGPIWIGSLGNMRGKAATLMGQMKLTTPSRK